MKKIERDDNIKILFVDDKEKEYKRFLELPFAEKHKSEIRHITTPVGLSNYVNAYTNLRLIVLDILWPGFELGADVMHDLSLNVPDVPVVIYSVIENDDLLQRLVPEMIRLGAQDWISKDEPKHVRSLRFQRIYMQGRNPRKIPASRSILPADQQHRSNVHLSIMFVDMCGFTALTNAVGGKNTVKILRKFYGLVGKIVMTNEGYVDKYIGDAVMAIFGAKEEPNKDMLYQYVTKCIRSAREIQSESSSFRIKEVEEVLVNMNKRLTAEEKNEIGKFRVGIESGNVEVARFERYNESEITFIGTPVNISSRILGEAGAGEVWIGQNAYDTGAKAVDIVNKKCVQYKNLPGKFNMYQIRP